MWIALGRPEKKDKVIAKAKTTLTKSGNRQFLLDWQRNLIAIIATAKINRQPSRPVSSSKLMYSF